MMRTGLSGPLPGMRRFVLVAWLLAVAGCAPTLQPMGPPIVSPSLMMDAIVAADGVELPLRSWRTDGEPAAVVLALHGFNDYSQSFALPGRWLSERGITVYAYDQRGFGRAPRPGIWPGTDTLVADLETAAALIRSRHPGRPFYLLGESMGGAVIIAALDRRGPTAPALADGVILSAPAIWGATTMPFYQRWAIWLTRNTVPWLTLTAPRELNIWPTDNIEVLRGLSADPLVIKSTRVDAIAGLTELMSTAFQALPRLDATPPALVLYGEREQVIPERPIEAGLAALPRDGKTVAIYPDGFHMLLRDLARETLYQDILAFIRKPGTPLPSGADQRLWTGAKGGAPPGFGAQG